MGSGQSSGLCHGGTRVEQLQGSQTRKRRRNSESNHNYVDRVRVKDSTHSFGGPGSGSGWRQRSLSNIDLSTNKKQFGNGINLREQYTGLYDLYSRIERRKDIEGLYGNNQKEFPNKSEPIYEQPEIKFGIQNPEACSLRRTRSLAVIREETFNDLQINGNRTRRSQLIPRAKLVEKVFFKDRFKYKNPIEDTPSGVDTQTSETQESDGPSDFYTNFNKFEGSQWQHDKSDLDSLDSNYFKHSLHQQNSDISQSHTEIITDFQVHSENSQSSPLAETTTSNSDSSDNYSTRRADTESVTEIKYLDDILLSEENLTDQSLSNSNTNTRNSSSESEIGKQTLVIELKGDSKHKDDIRSVISYDSIYLSSEASEKQITVEDSLEEENLDSEDVTSKDIKHEDYNLVSSIKISNTEEEISEVSIDSLYTEVVKTKPKIISLEPKVKNLTSFSDYSICGTLEKLTFITTPQLQKEYCELHNHKKQQTSKLISTEPYVSSFIDHQFYSLPDATIGKSLITSERIDAKLRAICDYDEETNKTIYDSISRFGRAHKRLRQRESCEIIVLNSISIDEQPKEAPSIEVKQPIKELKNHKKEYLTELGLDSDCCNSLETFTTPSDNSCLSTLNLPTTVNLGGKKVIVDEVAAKIRNREIETSKEINKTKTKITPEIKIVITDSESVENEITEQINFDKSEKLVSIPYFEKQEKEIVLKKNTDIVKKNKGSVKFEINNNKNDKSAEKLRSYDIFCARPVQILSKKDNNTYIRKESITNLIKNLNEQTKMSRPQIMHIVDKKRDINDCPLIIKDKPIESETNVLQTELPNEADQGIEFHDKVDSVRCYWTKLVASDDIKETGENEDSKKNEAQNYITSVEDIVKTIETVNAKKAILKNSNVTKFYETNLMASENTDFQSFCPTVEIIELDDQKHAAVVKTQHTEEADFDHIRYKVMKSDMFQKNLLSRNKKEAQFDGLIQYLQDYSFQELLAHNNVVIIEPVRTKIEKVSEKPQKAHRLSCRITGGSGKNSDGNKIGLKRHFFYHPIRVNKELLDEELPHPDTVKNVRKFFEGSLRMRSPNGSVDSTKNLTDDTKICGQHKHQNLRKKSLRYLTIDTSYGNTPAVKKWDSASLSSGISSGDLSSPCECGELENNSRFSSEENLCDEFCESHYVSQDILEKIRECGSTTTYYGGRVVDTKSSELSPMTKAIMQEIRGDHPKYEEGQLNNYMQFQDQTPNHDDSDNYLGVKFKLVKSNSCSSRLELIGATNIEENKQKLQEAMSLNLCGNRSPTPEESAEESVRSLVNRLETGSIHYSSAPRIIESKCIEKCLEPQKPIEPFTINNQLVETKNERLGPVDLINQVTVNNHISFCNGPTISGSENGRLNKISRNKNVDLAYTINKTVNKPTKEKENIAKKANLAENKEHKIVNNFDETKDIFQTAFENIAKLEERTKTQTTDIINTQPLNDIKSIEKLNKEIPKQFTENEVKTISNKTVDNEHVNQENVEITNKKSVSKWDNGTQSKFDEKFYVTNDVKLKEKKKYDEMEFEEFEVFDPNQECYDSLNEK